MVQIENSLTPEEFLAVLNAAPPSPAEYARFVKAYYQAIHPHASRQKLAELSERLQEWLERETSQGRAAFLSNYLAWAPAPEIPAAALRRVPQAASVTAARYCSGMDCVSAATWSTFGMRRSITRSVPPPLTRQGFFTMRSSRMAVLKIALSSR